MRKLPPIHRSIAVLLAGLVAMFALPAQAEDDLPALEEQAMRAAVERVEPSVVRIETVGGKAVSGRLVLGTGATTGLIVSDDGYVISSAFNFVQEAASILVTLPDGSRRVAERIATDHSRMLVLLKVDSNAKLTVPEAVPSSDMQVGQWAIAVGRTFAGDDVNLSMGIISALGRIRGRAIQTDAKVSPNNYGGPLVDIRGRVLGVLVPMSPQGSDEVAGLEWYDSGIGFAVPLAEVQKNLAHLKSGQDLHPGLLGVVLKRGNAYSLPAEIAMVAPNSPAADAGMKKGDRIIELDGRQVATQMHLRLILGSRYAGESIHVVARRGDDRIERDIELVDHLEPFEHAFLGVLPSRNASGDAPPGILVRYVYLQSPAAKAGIQIGDRITAIAGAQVAELSEAMERVNALSPGDTVAVELQRGSEKIPVQVVCGSLPSMIPDELPPARDELDAPQGDRPPVGARELKLPEFANKCRVYVPESYHPEVAYGVVVWLHGPAREKEEVLLERWKPLCDARDLILVAPQAADSTRWQRTEREFVRKTLDSVIAKYHVDPARIVVHGYQSGGAMAYLLAMSHRDVIHGAAVVDAPLPGLGRVPANEPLERLAIYATVAKKARFAARIQRGIKNMRTAKYPLTVKDQGERARYLNADEMGELARWIDTLDRL